MEAFALQKYLLKSEMGKPMMGFSAKERGVTGRTCRPTHSCCISHIRSLGNRGEADVPAFDGWPRKCGGRQNFVTCPVKSGIIQPLGIVSHQGTL